MVLAAFLLSVTASQIDYSSSEFFSAVDTGVSFTADFPVPLGSITIIKDTDPNSIQPFEFTTSGDPLSTFNLVDNSDLEGEVTDTKTFGGLSGGVYTITETLEEGYRVANIVCDDPGETMIDIGDDAVFDLDVDHSVTITLAEDEQVICTFTNELEEQELLPGDPENPSIDGNLTAST